MASPKPTPEQRLDLEARILLAAIRQSIERGDLDGANLAHHELSKLLADRAAQTAGDEYPQSPWGEDTDSQPGAPDRPAAGRGAAGGAAPEKAARTAEPGPVPAAERPAAGAREAGEPEPASPPEGVPIGDLYEALGVVPMSSIETIHVHYLRQVRKLLIAQQLTRDTSVWDFRGRLRAMSIAHDVLRDPVTRTDYDFRLLGLRGQSAPPVPELPGDMQTTITGTRPGLRIGELLQACEVLEAADLDVAVDMHRAMPNMPFGQFLVRQDFLSQQELDSALLGQRLIVDGKITVAQFQVAMFSVRSDGVPLGKTLVDRGWVTQGDVDERTREDPWAKAAAGDAPGPAQETPSAPAAGRLGGGAAQPRQPGAIETGNAVPSWADVLDWGEPPVSVDAEPSLEAAAAAGGAGAGGDRPPPVQAAEAGELEETSFEPEAGREPAPLQPTPVRHEGDDAISGLAMKSLADTLEEALVAEIHRLERESARDKPAGGAQEDGGAIEPVLDAGEVEPPPFPHEVESTAQPRAAGRRAREGAEDKTRSRPQGEGGSAGLDNDVE